MSLKYEPDSEPQVACISPPGVGSSGVTLEVHDGTVDRAG